MQASCCVQTRAIKQVMTSWGCQQGGGTNVIDYGKPLHIHSHTQNKTDQRSSRSIPGDGERALSLADERGLSSTLRSSFASYLGGDLARLLPARSPWPGNDGPPYGPGAPKGMKGGGIHGGYIGPIGPIGIMGGCIIGMGPPPGPGGGSGIAGFA